MAAVERETGLGLSFGSLSPSILDTLSLSDLVVRSPRGSPLLEARRVLVYYDLAAIIRGEGERAITAIRLETASVDVDVGTDKDILERLTRLLSGGSGRSQVAFSISGKDLALRVSVPETGSASLRVRDFDFVPGEAEAELSLSGDYRVDQEYLDLGSIGGPFSISGSLSRDLSRARLELGLSARARDFSLRTQRFEVDYSSERIELRKIGDEAAIDAEVGLDLGVGTLSARIRLDGFVPERSLKASGRLAWLAPWLATPYSGNLSLSLPAGDYKRIAYQAKIEGSLPTELLSRPLHAAIAASGNADGIDVEYARIEEGGNEFEYRGTFDFADRSPDGTLDLRLALFEGRIPVETSVRIYGNEGEYVAIAENVMAAGTRFRDLAAAAAWRGKQLDFRISFLLPEEGGSPDGPVPDLPERPFSGEAMAVVGSLPLIRCEGNASLGEFPSVELSVSLESVDLGPMRHLLESALPSGDAAGILAELRFGGEIFLSSDFKRLSWSAPNLAVVSRSIPDAYALLSLSGNLDSVTVRKASLSVAGYDLQCEGRADFGPGGVGFETSLRLRDVPYALHGSFVGGALYISGDYGLSVYARTSGPETVASFGAAELPIPVGGGHFLVDVEADGRFASAADWSLALASLSVVPTGEALARAPRVSLSGIFGPDSGELRELSVGDRFSSVSGPARIEYALDAPSAASSEGLPRGVRRGKIVASLGSKSTQERYDIDLAYSSGTLDGSLAFTASPLVRLGELPITGWVDGTASVRGRIEDPTLVFDARLRSAKYRDQPISAAANGSFAGGVITVGDARATYLGNEVSSLSCSVSLRDASSMAAFSYSGMYGGERLSLSLEARGSSLEEGGAPLDRMLRNYDAKGTVKGFTYGTFSTANWPFDASLSPSGARLLCGTQGELSLFYGFDGSFDIDARSPLPLRLLATGKLEGNSIDAEVSGIELDLPILSFFFSPSDLRLLSGVARGNLRVRGLVADPEMNGRLDLEGATLRVPGWIGDDIGPFDAPVLADGRSFSSSAYFVPVGKAAVSYRAQAALDHWAPSGLKVAIRSIEGAYVKLDTKLLGIQAEGEASFELDAELRGDTVFLGGDVAIDKATIVVSPEGWAAEAAAQGQRPNTTLFLSVDIDVGLGRGTRVIFPSTDFPIVSGYADRSSSLAIHYDQATEGLLLKGAVMLRGGDVFYIQRNFFLKSARMVFNESMDRFDPRITVLAELRDRNDEGPVLITLSATDAPITSFKPNLSSNPTMTEAQIAALLGQHLFDMESESDLTVQKAVISGSEFIPTLNVTKAFESRVREMLGLDIFYLKTQILQRWLIDLSDQTPAAASDSDPLGRYLDETEVYAGKYLGDSIFIYGSARLSEDPLVRAGRLSLDSELGVEFDTPFGLVQWTMAPSSPESLFISDQSLSVSWKLSY
jgi:hypothetical protein